MVGEWEASPTPPNATSSDQPASLRTHSDYPTGRSEDRKAQGVGRQSHYGEFLIRLSGWSSNRWLCPVQGNVPVASPLSGVSQHPQRGAVRISGSSSSLSRCRPPQMGRQTVAGIDTAPTKASKPSILDGVIASLPSGRVGSPSLLEEAVGRWWPSFHDGLAEEIPGEPGASMCRR